MIEHNRPPIEGYFKIEAIKDGEVVDCFEDHNTICINARLGMAKIFSQIFEGVANPYACKLALGTCGCTSSFFAPRVENKSYTRDLTSLFTEQYADDNITQYATQPASVLTPYKIYKYNNTYYRYLNPDNADSYALNAALLNDQKVFQKDYKPYLYTVGFDIQSKTYHSDDLGYKIVVEPSKSLCEAYVGITDTLDATDNDGNPLQNFASTVKFTWIIPKNYGNSQISANEFGIAMSFFSEAGLYINDNELFCYRAFPVKVKDSATALRITWKIIF